MRFPLLVCGTPKKLETFPNILLPAGRYHIIMENRIDTVVSPDAFVLDTMRKPDVYFVHYGEETNLNIYAEKIE